MDQKRDHKLQTHRLVSSGAGASAVSRNTSRVPTEPAAGISAEQDRLMPAGSPQDRQGSRSGGGRSAGLGESARDAECRRCRLLIRLQLCMARSLFILG